MEMMRGQVGTEPKSKLRALRIIDAALLVVAIVPPTIVMTVYAMFLLNSQRPVSYPWQLVTFGGHTLMALCIRRGVHRMSPARLAVLAVWFVLVAVSLTFFVLSSATGLAVAIERAIPT